MPKLRIESLEKRELMAADIDLFSNGFMDVDGTGSRDIIEIKDAGNNQVSVAVMDGNRTIRKGSDNVDKFQYFNKSDISSIRVDAGGGNDYVRNYTNLPTDINGSSGQDSLYGGSGVDDINGGTGDDYIHGGGGNDLLRGYSGKDTMYGSSGNDQMLGGEHDDYMNGGSGADKMEGGFGSDRMYGGSGHDRLWGDAGADYLYGQSGNDGMFGGDGIDRVYAGTGHDRVLENTKSDDYFYNLGSDDARIRFYDQASQTVDFSNGSGGTAAATYASGAWTDDEVELVDRAFEKLHNATGNTNLLKTSSGGNLRFYRQGAWQFTNDPSDATSTEGSTVTGWNSGNGYITMSERGMSATDNFVMSTVLHEIGHNWDASTENSTIDDFRDLSGWAPIRTMVYSGRAGGYYVYFNTSLDSGGDTGDNWGFERGNTNFVREYGKENPLEDFATSFAAYFMDGAGRGNPSGAPDKMNYMADFVDSKK